MSRSTVITGALLASLSLSFAGVARSRQRANAQASKPAATQTKLKFSSKQDAVLNQKTGEITLNGNARLEMDNSVISAAKIVFKLNQDRQVQEVRATTGVRIELSAGRVASASSQPIVATCREAVYREATKQMTLEGPVTITGKGRPDSTVLSFNATGQRALIDMGVDGTVVKFEGESEFEVLLPGDVGLGKPAKTPAAPGKSN